MIPLLRKELEHLKSEGLREKLAGKDARDWSDRINLFPRRSFLKSA